MGLVLAGAAALLSAPLFSRAEMIAAYDSATHLHWAASFTRTLGQGAIYPRWQGEAFSGFGAPTFIFYPALPYFAAAAASALGIAPALKLAVALALFLSGVAAYSFLRDILARGPAIGGALAYMAFPAHLVQVSPLFLFASQWGLVFLPLAFRGARRAARGYGVISLAAGAGALLATHLPTAAVGIPGAVLYGFFSCPNGGRGRALAAMVLGLAGGAALGAIYWLPALAESSLVHSGYHLQWNRLQDNFLFAASHPLGEGHLAVNQLLTASATLAALASGLALLIGCPKPLKREFRALGALAGLSFFFMTGLARPIWELVPGAGWLEFPWRFQNLQLLAASSLCALVFSERRPGWERAIAAGVLAGTVGIGLLMSAVMLSRIVFFSPELQREGLATGLFELGKYRPATAPPAAAKYELAAGPRPPEVEVLKGQAAVELNRWYSEEKWVRVRASEPVTLRLRIFAYPGWDAELEGRSFPLSLEKGSGALVAELPAGQHELRVFFRATLLRQIAALASALAAALLLIGAVRSPSR